MNANPDRSHVKVAVVGLGAIGQEHVDIYRAAPEAELVAVVDPRADVREEVATRTGVAAYATLADLLAEGAADAISLCTPDHLHFEDATSIIAAGVHLLLEKPITTDPAEADALTQIAEASDVVVMPGHTLRFEPRYAAARQAVADGRLGQVQHGYLRRDNKVSVADRAAGRTSVAFFLGIHDIDALQWITDQQVTEVQALATGATERTGQQAMAVLGTLRLADGAVVQIESAWNLPEDYPTDLDAAFRLVGNEAALSVHSFDAGMHVAGGGFTLPMTAGASLYGAAQGPLALELGTFLRCCLDDAVPPVTMRQAASAVKVVIALEEAVASGLTVAVAPVAAAGAGA
ncbi:Gfo/Idh/MocA family protein [Ruania alba]|uniref:Predicted dehydrogenase n=1 Tax=Ruania alba TaxID=648782 RepID=A0A1H5LBZ9_9MICO|nr:Gfo/Idh/MocA family oxidoreductase [Ruania alba]SEE74582.1 Predicted dehydrogenase [Ruania alba]